MEEELTEYAQLNIRRLNKDQMSKLLFRFQKYKKVFEALKEELEIARKREKEQKGIWGKENG